MDFDRSPHRQLVSHGAATVGVIFVVVGLVGVGARPPSSDPLRQVDPDLAILEVLMMLFAVVLVIMMATVYAYASLERKTFALAALAFAVVFAVLTCGAHFANVTVGRQIAAGALLLLSHQLSFEKWTGVYALGAPRQIEFGLRLSFQTDRELVP